MSDETTSVSESVSVGLTTILRPVTPDQIARLLVSKLSTDPVLKPLLGVGVVAGDPRVYWYYQPTAIIDASRKAYLTYMHSALPEFTQAVGEPVFSISVWGISGTVVEAVRDRLVALFDDEPLVLPNGRQLWGARLGEHDNYQENTKFAGKNIQFRFGFSRV